MASYCDKLIWNNQNRRQLVKLYQDSFIKKTGHAQWEKFIRTLAWCNIYDRMSQCSRDMFKMEWEKIAESRGKEGY